MLKWKQKRQRKPFLERVSLQLHAAGG
jgi:hypothetical protein